MFSTKLYSVVFTMYFYVFSVSDSSCDMQRVPGIHGLNRYYDDSMMKSETDCALSCLFDHKCGKASLVTYHGVPKCRKYMKEMFSLTVDRTSMSFNKVCPWGKL